MRKRAMFMVGKKALGFAKENRLVVSGFACFVMSNVGYKKNRKRVILKSYLEW